MEVRRVLIYRLGSLGDSSVAFPCLHLIARSFPDAERRLLTNFPVHAKAPAAAAVIGSSGLVHSYMRYAVGTRSPLELARLWWRIRSYRPDVLVYLMPVRSERAVRRDVVFFRSAGIKRFEGLPTKQTGTHRYYAYADRFESEAERLARTLTDLGEARPQEPESWDLCLSHAEKALANKVLAPLAGQPMIVCGIGTKMQAKDWGLERWCALLGKLSLHYPNRGLVFVGAKEDAHESSIAARAWSGPSLNLCGSLHPREAAAVIAKAEVFLGPDSGPMHFAAATGVPAVIAFSARGKPGIWFPAGSNHHVLYRKTECFGCNLETCLEKGRKCLKQITVDDMFGAVQNVLGVQDRMTEPELAYPI